MLAKRIIPCLDVDNGRVVKGVNFTGLKDAGDPVELATYYNDEGADELVFLDITASSDNRNTMIDVVQKTAEQIFIPFTVGGGIRTVEDMTRILRAGADKISVNSAAIANPALITDGANAFGNQCIVVAIDAKKKGNSWTVYIHGGRKDTGIDLMDWAKQAVTLGAGEILLTSMDRDGTKGGFDSQLTRIVSESVPVPVIASGGAGEMRDFEEVLTKGKADAALAASVFHFGKIKIKQLKDYLKSVNISIRETL